MTPDRHIKYGTQIGFLILALFAIGCAHPPFSKESLGTIGVAIEPQTLTEEAATSGSGTSVSGIAKDIVLFPVEIGKRTVAFGAGFLSGCFEGFAEMPNPGGGGPEIVIVVLALGSAMCAVGGLVDGTDFAVNPDKLYGAKNESKEKPNLFKYYVDILGLRDHVVAALNKTFPESALPRYHPLEYDSLAANDIDTVLNISVENISIGGTGSKDDPLSLSIKIGVRLIKTKDKDEFYDETFSYQAEDRVMQNDKVSRVFISEELDRGYQNLAEQIASEIFQKPPPEN